MAQPMQMGGFTPAIARMALGMDQMPSPCGQQFGGWGTKWSDQLVVGGQLPWEPSSAGGSGKPRDAQQAWQARRQQQQKSNAPLEQRSTTLIHVVHVHLVPSHPRLLTAMRPEAAAADSSWQSAALR